MEGAPGTGMPRARQSYSRADTADPAGAEKRGARQGSSDFLQYVLPVLVQKQRAKRRKGTEKRAGKEKKRAQGDKLRNGAAKASQQAQGHSYYRNGRRRGCRKSAAGAKKITLVKKKE